MKRSARAGLCLAACVVVLTACERAPGAAPGKPATGALEADALKLVARYDEAWMRKDLPAIEKILAPSYVYFSSRGGVSDLAKTRASLASPGYRMEKGVRDELEARRYGATVVVGSHWVGAGVFDGQPFADDQRCSIVVGFADGSGRVLSEHCSNIPAPPPPTP